VLGGLLGVALGRYVWPAIRDSHAAALLAAQMQPAATQTIVLTSYLRRCGHTYRLRYRRSRPFNWRKNAVRSVSRRSILKRSGVGAD
jgi:hypothetical protein